MSQPAEQQGGRGRPQPEQLSASIGGRVLRTLGTPGGPYRVQVRRLWDDHYRVNVVLGEDGLSARIAHSYFLVADGDGNILACTPRLTREYGGGGSR